MSLAGSAEAEAEVFVGFEACCWFDLDLDGILVEKDKERKRNTSQLKPAVPTWLFSILTTFMSSSDFINYTNYFPAPVYLVDLGRFPFCQNFRFAIPEIFRVKRKGFLHESKKLEISLVDRDGARSWYKREQIRKWNGNFRSNRGNGRNGGPPKVVRLFRKFPFEPRVPFAFQPVGPEILAKWKVPQATQS